MNLERIHLEVANDNFSPKMWNWPAPGFVDTRLSESSLLLELHRAQISNRRVPSFWIVEAFDVIEHVGLGLIARAINLPCCSLGFERREEALHCGIVPDVAGSAHRTNDAVIGHQPLDLLAAVLGGFKRSSQRVVCLHTVLAYQALRLAFSSQVSCVVSD